VAKYILHNDVNLFDFVLIGITSPENQYVIVNNVNESLNIDLALSQTLRSASKDTDLFDFSVYSFLDEELGLEYCFLPNKSNFRPKQKARPAYDLFAESKQSIEQSILLISELPHTNYFLILKGESAIHEQYNVYKLLRKIECIEQVHEIIPDKLQSKNNLIF
jgi:hypothetical protein